MIDSVGIGDLSRLEERAVLDALDDAAGADLVTDLPDGLATMLGTSYAPGTELSGGQWQRVALARTLMRRGSSLLILDEPAAALDPAAEQALFDTVAAIGRQQAGDRKSLTILISHRLSSVRSADLIIVMRDGRIVERGTHESLMEADDGTYAELFRLQTRVYQ